MEERRKLKRASGVNTNRRSLLKLLGLGAVGVPGAAVSTELGSAAASSTGTPTYTLGQGSNTWNLVPVRNGESAASFFGTRRAGYDYELATTTGVEASDTGRLFLYEDPDGTPSLITTLDESNDGSGGSATVSFEGLPGGGNAADRLFAESFDDGTLDGWNTSSSGNADVTTDDGRLRLRVYRCSTAKATRNIGTHSGRLRISFAWEGHAEGWYEMPDWRLEDGSGAEIDYTVVDGTDVRSVGGPGESRSGRVVVEADADGEINLVYTLTPSDYCSYGDHYDTYFWIDNIVVSEAPETGEWIARDSPSAFPPGSTPVNWSWDAAGAAGGVFQGGLDDEFAITVDPSFEQGISSWTALVPSSVSYRPFELDNESSSADRTEGWKTVTQDLSEFAGQSVTIEFAVNGRHTYDREDTRSWIKAKYVTVDGVLDEQFDDLDGWAVEIEGRDGQYNDTPVKGFARVEDGSAFVQEASNRTRYLKRRVEIPPDGNPLLRAEVKGHVSAAWSFSVLSVHGHSNTASDLEEIALDPSKPVTIKGTSGSGGGTSSDLSALIEQKNTLIDDIRGSAARPLGAQAANDSVDQRAEALLADIGTDAFGATDAQYTECLERMIGAETVTQSATESVTADDSPTNSVLRDLYSATTGSIIELLPMAGEGILKRVLNSMGGEIGRQLDDIARSLSGRGVIPSNTLADVERTLDDFALSGEESMEQWFDQNPDKAAGLISEIEGGRLKMARAIGETVVDATTGEQKQQIIDRLNESYFRGYYFAADWPEVEIPLPSELEFQDIHYEYDLPNEDLPTWLRESVPDKIAVNFDADQIDVPGAPALEELVPILNELQDVATPSGVNTTIEERMRELDSSIGDFGEQNDRDREDLSSMLADGIDELGALVHRLIGDLESAQDIINDFGNGAAALAVLGAVVGALLVVTGVGTVAGLSFASLMATVSTALGILSLVIDTAQLALSQGYITYTNRLHHLGTYGIANTTLGGVTR